MKFKILSLWFWSCMVLTIAISAPSTIPIIIAKSVIRSVLPRPVTI